MPIYREIVNGKIVTTNVKGLFGTRIEVYTEEEFIKMQQASWWEKAIKKIKSL
jgi:hypothetical protein